jgi:hypothetical protein
MPYGLIFSMIIFGPSRIITNQFPETFHENFRSFFARFGVYTVIFAGWSYNSDYCLLGGLRVWLRLRRVVFDWLSFSFLSSFLFVYIIWFICIPYLLSHRILHILQRSLVQLAQITKKSSLKLRGTDNTLTSAE